MDKTRMLIIGARGFLGAHATSAARKSFDVITGSREAAVAPGSVQIDIADEASVESAFRLVRPDVVLLLAALSDIDRCEAQPELAKAINVRGPENVANACARTDSKLVFTSSAAVFDGRKHGYVEEDAPTPLSVYGETKARAEAAVLKILPSVIVLRFGLVIGFSGKTGTNAMLDSLAATWASGSTVATPTFEFRNPIDAGTLSTLMLDLLQRRARGIFHIGSTDSLSRYELTARLAKRMGYSSELVQPQMVPSPGRAPRGLDHFLKTEKIHALCNISIPNCDEVIERSFDEAA
jgi:dTDP-4-dehydrorhamnose reductase